MPTQGYTNRQAPTTFSVDFGAWTDILATCPGTPVYEEGMSVNGGASLYLEVDAGNALDDISLRALRRSDADAAWSVFWTGTATTLTVFTERIVGLGGFADVRVQAQPEALAAQVIRVSAKISAHQ